MAGLVLVVLARGLGSLFVLAAARTQAKLVMDPATFDDRWADRIEKETDEFTGADKTQRLAELHKKRDEDRNKLLKGEWRDLKRDAEYAASRGRIRAYWLEWIFVIGAMALTFGLVTVALRGAGAERIVCLIMIAIITFSLFVGGSAWLSTLKIPAGG